jgi:hypothetical protein
VKVTPPLVAPAAISPVSNLNALELSAVAVWFMLSLFFQVTVVPMAMVKGVGLKAEVEMVTTFPVPPPPPPPPVGLVGLVLVLLHPPRISKVVAMARPKVKSIVCRIVRISLW